MWIRAPISYSDLPHYWVNHLSFILRKRLVADFAAAGFECSAEEWALLLLLAAHPRITPTELARQTVRDKTTVTRMLDGLARKGLLSRTPDEKDRRVLRVELRDAGRERFDQLRPIAESLIEQSLTGISKTEVQKAVSVLTHITKNLQNPGEQTHDVQL